MIPIKSYKLFLDDFRKPNEVDWIDSGEYNSVVWVIARSFPQFTSIIRDRLILYGQLPYLVSFDHDLTVSHYRTLNRKELIDYNSNEFANDENKTGYHAAIFIRDLFEGLQVSFPKILVHSMNEQGRENIKEIFNNGFI